MSHLVSCGKQILVHDQQSDPIVSISPHKSNINSAIWNHNNCVIASAGNDGAIILSHAQKGENLLTLEHNGKPLNSIAFTSNSQFLASGGQDSIVRIWDLKKKGVLSHLKGHYSSINALSWNSLDSLVASASNVGDLIIHDVATQIPIATLNLPGSKTPGFKCVKFLQGTTLFSGANDGSVTVWDVNTRDTICNFTCQHNSKVNGISQSISGILCSVGIDQKVNFYSVNDKKCIQSIYCENPLSAVSFNNDGVSVAVGNLYGQIQIYDTRMSQKAKLYLKGHENTSVNYLEYQKLSEEERNSRTTTSILIPTQSFLKESNLSQKSEQSQISNKSMQSDLLRSKDIVSQRIDSQKQSQIEQFPSYQKKNGMYTDSKTNITITQQKSNFELSTSKIEDITRKYDKIQTVQEGNGFNEEQKKYLSQLMQEQFYQMKQLVLDQIGTMHIDMIRQFQIQQNDIQKLMEHYMSQQNKLVQRISQLEQENFQLKNQTY